MRVARKRYRKSLWTPFKNRLKQIDRFRSDVRRFHEKNAADGVYLLALRKISKPLSVKGWRTISKNTL